RTTSGNRKGRSWNSSACTAPVPASSDTPTNRDLRIFRITPPLQMQRKCCVEFLVGYQEAAVVRHVQQWQTARARDTRAARFAAKRVHQSHRHVPLVLGPSDRPRRRTWRDVREIAVHRDAVAQWRGGE